MNRPPQPGSGDEPARDIPWYLRRPDSTDHTSIARPRPHAANPTPSPPYGRPPVVNPPRPSPDTPWYLQRPDPPPAPAPRVAQEKPAAAAKDSAATDLKKFIPWALVGALGLAVLIGVTILIGNIARPSIGGRSLDVTKVQSGVLQTLSDPASGYGANIVTDVSCNGGRNPSADRGTTFTCDATVNGASRHVTVVVSDDSGTYEIDGPR